MVVRSRHKEPAIAANSAARAKVKKPSGDTILDPIITMNAAGDIHSASESIEQVFGWTPTELFGTNIKALVPEPRRIALERFLDRYRLAAPTKTFQRTRRFDAVRKDGKRIQVELTISLAPPSVALVSFRPHPDPR